MPWRCARTSRLQQRHLSPGCRHEHHSRISSVYRSVISNAGIRRESTVSAPAAQPVVPIHEAPTETSHRIPAQSPAGFSKYADLLYRPPDTPVGVKVGGLVRSIRKQKAIAFAHISDGTTFAPLQAVLNPEEAGKVHNGAYVELEGTWQQSPGGKQGQELQVTKVLNVGASDVESSPLQKKHMTVDHLRTYPHMRLRVPTYALLARVRDRAINAARMFYQGLPNEADEAVFVQPPIITSSDCEGAGEVFTVSPNLQPSPHAAEAKDEEQQHYFRKPKYLTVSSQLHLEAFSAELGDVWTLTPAFRAEASDTGRHLAELWMLEAEHRGVTELSDLTDRVQRLILQILYCVRDHRTGTELREWYKNPKTRPEGANDIDIETRHKALDSGQWQTITYTDAMQALEETAAKNPAQFERQPAWEGGLSLEHEKWIVEHLAKRSPVFVTHYPKPQKPFYMLPDTDPFNAAKGRETVACFDLLFPSGTCEVVGGSLREHRLENLIQSMREKGLLNASSHAVQPIDGQRPSETVSDYPLLKRSESLGTLEWYADLRRYGSSPHGGFGLGFDRLLMHLTGVTNVRDIVPFPRTYKNCIA